MAGHSKWANIKHRKGAQDAKKGKVFTKIIKEITVAARLNGGDQESNPRLRRALLNARSNNMPQSNIIRAIKKGTGELEGVNYEEYIYEGYGPCGIAIIIEVITDNKNRTVSELRYILNKNNGSLSEPGSVLWMFEKKGEIIIENIDNDENQIISDIIDCGADDFKKTDSGYIILTNQNNLSSIRAHLQKLNYSISSSSIIMVPKSKQAVSNEDQSNIIQLLELIDNHDDVNQVFSNILIE
tara:strand:- start:673 stop:1395 length:723 start_codon:yes stop_codon:yes gene_type:complete